MQTSLRCFIIAGCVAGLLAGASPAAAQDALPFVPQVRSAYQQRAEAIAKGTAGNVFSGLRERGAGLWFPVDGLVADPLGAARAGAFLRRRCHFPSWVMTAAHCVIAPQLAAAFVEPSDRYAPSSPF